jgi:hypothetical protein
MMQKQFSQLCVYLYGFDENEFYDAMGQESDYISKIIKTILFLCICLYYRFLKCTIIV